MANILPFQPKARMSATQNLTDFVDFAKRKLTVFGGEEFNWDALAWSRKQPRSGFSGTTQTVGWVKLGYSSRSKDRVPLHSDFIDFAKANLRHAVSFRPSLHPNTRMQALRCLEKALLRETGSADIRNLNGHIANKAAAEAVTHYSSGAAYRTSNQIAQVIEEAVRFGLLERNFKWKPTLKRPKTDAIGAEAEARANKKLPADDVFSALAQAYHRAKEPFDVFFTAIITFMAFSHMRVSELYRIDAYDCERTKTAMDPDTGKEVEYWGVVFDPSKGDQSFIKWYPHSVAPIARDALRRAIAASESGRDLFRAFEEDRVLSLFPEEFRSTWSIDAVPARALRDYHRSTYLSLAAKTGIHLSDDIPLQDLRGELQRRMPRSFPFASDTDLRLSHSLMVLPAHSAHRNRNPLQFLPILVSQSSVRNRLGAKPGQVKSIFDIAGEPYNDLRVTSHQFRHAMTTLLVEGGADELDIARNAGRFRVEDNAAYDHSLHSASRRFIDESDADDVLGTAVAVTHNRPISIRDVLEGRIDMSHLTEFGCCDLSWSGSPCSFFRDCINCNHNICIKGDHRAEENLRARHKIIQTQLRRAEEKIAAGHEGGGRWYDHHKRTLTRMEELIAVIDDPTTPIGTVIRAGLEEKRMRLHVQSQHYLNQDDQSFIDDFIGES